jgi:c-di-GMP-binding flagellar brake protein YcgR
MFEDTRPAAFDAMGSNDPWAAFRVPNADARASLLRELRDGSVPVTVCSPRGASLRTAIWAIDTAQQRLNFSVDDGNPQLQQLVHGDEAVAVAYMHSVKVQFDLANLMLVRGLRACTLQADLPSEVYRFQRREAFRVRAPQRQSPSARLRHPAIPEMELSLRLLDVSVGGCALWLPDDVPLLQAGTLVGEAHVELDEQTRFSSGLLVQHVSAAGTDEHGVRLGCEWAALGGLSERVLQRWIDLAQKRRRLLSLT